MVWRWWGSGRDSSSNSKQVLNKNEIREFVYRQRLCWHVSRNSFHIMLRWWTLGTSLLSSLDAIAIFLFSLEMSSNWCAVFNVARTRHTKKIVNKFVPTSKNNGDRNFAFNIHHINNLSLTVLFNMFARGCE